MWDGPPSKVSRKLESFTRVLKVYARSIRADHLCCRNYSTTRIVTCSKNRTHFQKTPEKAPFSVPPDPCIDDAERQANLSLLDYFCDFLSLFHDPKDSAYFLSELCR